jgi:hypothetical protein
LREAIGRGPNAIYASLYEGAVLTPDDVRQSLDGALSRAKLLSRLLRILSRAGLTIGPCISSLDPRLFLQRNHSLKKLTQVVGPGAEIEDLRLSSLARRFNRRQASLGQRRVWWKHKRAGDQNPD